MAGVAAAGWEDAIDVDDSDLPSLLSPPPPRPPLTNPSFPSLRPCSQPARPSSHSKPPDTAGPQSKPRSETRKLIPGPAGAVQAAMLRRSASPAVPPSRTGPRPETEVGVDFRPDLGADDEDFKMNPWLSALNFLGHCHVSSVSIGSIKSCGSDSERVPQVSGIVKSCRPNGLGDLFITLKDPTGMIDASVHRTVIEGRKLGDDISVGCVLILKQVIVLRPVRLVCYLNITFNNVVKLISNDYGFPSKQPPPTFTAGCGTSNTNCSCCIFLFYFVYNRMEDGSGTAETAPAMRRGTKTMFTDQMERNSSCEPVIGNRVPEGAAASLSNNIRTSAAPTNMVAMHDNRTSEPKNLMSTAPTSQTSNAEELAAANNIVAMPNHRASDPKMLTSNVSTAQRSSAQGAQKNTNGQDGINSDLQKLLHGRNTQAVASSLPCRVSTIPVRNITLQSDTGANQHNKRSIAQWTDEQLAELFADSQDDPEFG
ncbi:putative recombination protein [Dioscorea sansibarensis]